MVMVTMIEIRIAKKMSARNLEMTAQHRIRECGYSNMTDSIFHINKIFKSFYRNKWGKVLSFYLNSYENISGCRARDSKKKWQFKKKTFMHLSHN